MVAFVLIGLRVDTPAPPAAVARATGLPPAPIARPSDADSLPGARAASSARSESSADGAAEAIGQGEATSVIAWPGEPAPEPTPRLPSETAPAGPDLTVALPTPAPWAPVLAHAHVPGSAHVQAQWTPEEMPDAVEAAAAAPTQPGDVVQGVYWFGPRGLERIRILGEVPE